MPNINLKATLQAYSKAPFYKDWVRDVTAQGDKFGPIQEISNPDGTTSKVAWVRAIDANTGNYQWYPIDISLVDKETVDTLLEKVAACEKALDEGLSGIYLSQPYLDESSHNLVLAFYNTYGWLDDNDERHNVQVINLPAAYADNKTIFKNLNNGGLLSTVNEVDNDTIKIVHQLDDEGNPIAEITYDQANNPVKVYCGKYRAEGLFVANPVSEWAKDNRLTSHSIDTALHVHDTEIEDLKQIVQGKAGYLDPITEPFRPDPASEATKEIQFQTYLTNYALDQIFGSRDNHDISSIPDQTKIIYLPKGQEGASETDGTSGLAPDDDKKYPAISAGHTYTFVHATWVWEDSGFDTIVEANNSGVRGVVTGTAYDKFDEDTYFKVSVARDGSMSVNHIKEEFAEVRDEKVDKLKNLTGTDVAYIQTEEGNESYTEITTEPFSDTLAKRKSDGSLECAYPREMNGATVLNYMWYEEQFASDQDIKNLWGTN